MSFHDLGPINPIKNNKILTSCTTIFQKINTSRKGKLIVFIVILNLEIIKNIKYLIYQGNNEYLLKLLAINEFILN